MPAKESKPKREQRGALAVRDELREDILWVRLAPGTALDEVVLAKRFGMSRTPIREALLLLSGNGLVQFLPNRTSIVAPFLMNNLGDYIDTFLLLSRAAARSAAVCGKTDIEKLGRLVFQNREAAREGDIQTAFNTDNELRMEIAQASGNIFQIKYFRQVLMGGHRARVICYYPAATTEEQLSANERMEMLIEYIAQGNAEQADRVMSELIMEDMRVVRRTLNPVITPHMSLDGHPVANEEDAR